MAQGSRCWVLMKTVANVLVIVPKVIAHRNSNEYVDKVLRGEAAVLSTTCTNSSVVRPNVFTQ